MHNKKSAFTLVELIIVIIIISILGTIAFIALQGYSTNARDSSRISDIANMKTSLELFQLDSGKYPNPTDYKTIIYSGSTVWKQGTFGESVFVNITKLNKIPLDPLLNNEYTYSVTDKNNEYQIGGLIEGDTISLQIDNNITNASETTATAFVSGNYNEVMIKTITGTTCNILSVPTIITNDISITNLQTIVDNNLFVYRGYKNLPSSFKNTKFKFNGGFDFKPNNLIAYTDTGSCSDLTSKANNKARAKLIKGLQNSYTGTILKNTSNINKILNFTIDENYPSSELISFANNLVNNNLGSKLPVSSFNNQSLIVNNNTTISPTKYRINFNNPYYFTVNSNNTMTKNGLKLYQFPAQNICYGKTVVCSSGLTQAECNRSCDQTDDSTYEITTLTNWMRYDLGYKYIVNQLQTLSYETSGLETIKDFELYGSNDDSNYTLITTGIHPNIGGYQTKNFTNNTAYRYYRFNVLSHYPGNGGNNRYLRDLKLNSIASYPSDNYYATTTNEGETFHLNTLGITNIQKITVSDNKPAGTNVKYLFSFDGKNTWYYFNGTNWVQTPGGLNDIGINGMTSEFLNAISAQNLSFLNSQTSIDIDVGLYTSDVLSTPTVNYMDFNYISSTITGMYTSCKDIKNSLPSSTDGVYNIFPNYKYQKQVYCDMTTDGGGWTMVSALSPTGAVSYTDIQYTLTGNFVSPIGLMSEFTNVSTETRYNCIKGTSILDLKTTNNDIRDRQFSTGLRCTDGYWYTFANAASNFTGIGNNNYTPVTNAWHGSCLNANINLNVSTIGLDYTHWFMVDQTSKSLSCAGATGTTQFMRVFVR